MIFFGKPVSNFPDHALAAHEAHGGQSMFPMLTAPGLTLLFLGIVVGLGVSFVWIFWEIEQVSKSQLSKSPLSKSHRNGDRFG
jgi:predicted negative regulator of RcsB-dependent stress response